MDIFTYKEIFAKLPPPHPNEELTKQKNYGMSEKCIKNAQGNDI